MLAKHFSPQVNILVKYKFISLLVGGPTSQHDTIELRGFEDIPEEQVARGVSKKQSSSQSRAGKSSKYEGMDQVSCICSGSCC
jgi:hypothetical protein